jgi:hypothetical protein
LFQCVASGHRVGLYRRSALQDAASRQTRTRFAASASRKLLIVPGADDMPDRQ